MGTPISATIFPFSPTTMTLPHAVLIPLLAISLTACGIKGDLFIPERPASSAADGNKTGATQ
ncbi:MAG: hypothetical protein KDF24_15115 [Rhodocyclaceae bacterium]|nr:hypothetical protein [Rhodocyclaceae bacterium]